MKTTVFCKVTAKGVHTFYLNDNGANYYLFHQDYRIGVQEYYGKGVTLTEAMNFGRSHHNSAIKKTMQKLPVYVKYVEKEYGIQVLEQTIKKNQKPGKRRAAACA